MEQVDMSPKVAAILLKPGKDSRWLTLEVCREFARDACPRSDEECKYAHPPSHAEVQNGKVICCFDFIKSKCQRNNPPCKYLHPPSHLKEQLLETGRQNLIVKNLQLQSALSSGLLQPVLAGSSIPLVAPSKTVVPSAYQAVLVPGQQPYATAGSPYVISSPSPVVPQYQILGSAQGSLPGYHGNGLIQVVNPAQYANIIPLNVFNNHPSYPIQVLPYIDSMQPTVDSSLKINQSMAPQSQVLHAYENSVEEKSNGLGRKRAHEIQSGTFAPPLKRTALVDAKSGLPVYAQVPPQQLSLASMSVQQPQYFPISLTPHATLLQRF